jgi:murein DD-endopeptidase MepM/ murein hydrolase activator NlpD
MIDAAINAGSAPRQLWRGSFLRPLGKVMSSFIEQRTYLYKGTPAGRSVHYGLDIADVANSPVRAGAQGRVVLAAPAGVYGNCIIIDHGLNLFTLYAHLSELQVQAGDNVTMGQQIGLSGTTGFSFGDHLHFSCMIGRTFVTPYEWWDPKWIAANVELRFKEAGVAPPH